MAACWASLYFRKSFCKFFTASGCYYTCLPLFLPFPSFMRLYIQFDLHPEKTVFDRHNVSGIRWFLWDSQFGRFVNNGPIKHKNPAMFSFLYIPCYGHFYPGACCFITQFTKALKAFGKRLRLSGVLHLKRWTAALLVYVLAIAFPAAVLYQYIVPAVCGNNSTVLL
jgi:hypothetical protein